MADNLTVSDHDREDEAFILAAWMATGLTTDQAHDTIRDHYARYDEYARQADLAYRRASRQWNRSKPGRLLTLWAATVVGDEHRLLMRVAARGGTHRFPILLTSSGELAPAQHVTTHAGPAWLIYRTLDEANSPDANATRLLPATPTDIAAAGYTEATQTRPATVAIVGTPTTRKHAIIVPADGLKVNPHAPIHHPQNHLTQPH